jgi:uncharacterized protein (DUF2236 family)
MFGEPAGDPGLIGPGSVSWELNSDVGAIAVAGMAAIVLEMLHPSVAAGVQQQSSYREDPFRRARTTFGWVITTTFASTAAATRLINAVKRMHGQVNGVRPDGVEYRALDPELIGWVHTCIPWMIMTAYERFHRRLTPREHDRYLAEQAAIGRMSGADDIPETHRELGEYVEHMRPKLAVTEHTREFMGFLLDAPFGTEMPGPLRPYGKRFQVEAGMTLAPRWAAEMVGFAPPRPVTKLIHEPLLRSYAMTLRWGFGTPRYTAMAEARATATQTATGEEALDGMAA